MNSPMQPDYDAPWPWDARLAEARDRAVTAEKRANEQAAQATEFELIAHAEAEKAKAAEARVAELEAGVRKMIAVRTDPDPAAFYDAFRDLAALLCPPSADTEEQG